MVLLMATLACGFFNYLFNMLMARVLQPANYSIMSSLFSLLVIISIPVATIQTVIAKYSADFRAKEQIESIRKLFTSSIKRTFFLSLVLLSGLIIFSQWIARYLQISSAVPVILTSLVLIPTVILPINRGILQGLEKFISYSLTAVSESFFRVVFGLTLALIGLGIQGDDIGNIPAQIFPQFSKIIGSGVNGSIIGVVLAPVVAVGLSFWLLRSDIFIKRSEIINTELTVQVVVWREIYQYALPVMISLLCFTVLISSDLIFVKHFFTPTETGYYSAAEVIGKIALFLPSGIIPIMMFPKTAALHVLKKDSWPLLQKSLLAALAMCGGLTFFYWLFSRLIMLLLYGEGYLNGAPLLWLFGLAMTFYTLVNILINYYLSQRYFRFLSWLIAMTIIQILLIQLFHGSLAQVICVMIGCGLGLLMIMLVTSRRRSQVLTDRLDLPVPDPSGEMIP